MKEILNAQREHWQKMFARNSDMFGTEPSDPARFAAEPFKKESKTRILELGGGTIQRPQSERLLIKREN
jgi:hypothetical protein